MRLDFSLQNLADTDALARALAAVLERGDALALSGDLGAGKTTLVRAIAAARGINPGLVSSPTFVIVNEYPGGADDTPLVHVDAFRLTSAEDLDALGWDRLADGSSILLIEWAERISDALFAANTAALALRPTGEHSRAATLECPSAWADRDAFEDLRALAADGLDARLTPREPTTCPTTGRPVPADSPTWPFANEQARMADLYKWFSGQHQVSRPIEQRDLDEMD